jgi:hypothetical protein
MNKLMVRLISLALLSICSSLILFGQATDVSKGNVTVSVKDPSGATVPGATVTLSGPRGELNATTSNRGEASFSTLLPGSYSARVALNGFATAEVKNLNVEASKTASLDVTLQPGQVNQTVEVSESATQIDTTSTTVQTSLNADTYGNLPVTRNVTSLMYLAPGVASGGLTGNANPSISGASGLENQYIIDGISDTDSGYGGFGVYSDNYGSKGTGVNFDFVQEVQVKTGGFEAQYGKATGGIINVVTKSGTNEIHGSAYGYASPYWAEPSYNQVDAFRVSQPVTEIHGQTAYDFGFNLGGPIKKDKFFWYGSFNPTWTKEHLEAPPNFLLRNQGVLTQSDRSLSWVGKLNYALTDSQRLEATAFGDPSISPKGVQWSPTTTTSYLRDDTDSASSLDYGTRNWAVKYSGAFGPRTIVSASFAWNHSYFDETPANPDLFQYRDYTEVKPNAIYTLKGGLGYIGNNDGNNKQYNAMISQNLHFLGGHQFDLGFSFNKVNYDAIHTYSGPQWAVPAAGGIDPGDVGKLVNGGFFYLYPTENADGTPIISSATGEPTRAACFAAGLASCYRVSRGNFSSPGVSTNTSYEDAFLQDAWQVNRFLTVKAGVRWEQQHLFGNLNNYVLTGNWSPRIGFIVDPTGRGRTKIFGNWGRYFEEIPQDLAVRALSQESSYANGYFSALPTSSSTPVVPVGVNPDGTAATNNFSPVGTSPTLIYPGTRAGYEEEVVAGLEQDLGHGIILRASFTDRSLKRGIEDTSGITVEQALAGSPQQYVIQNPNVNSDTFHNAVTCVDGTANCTNGSGYTDDSGSLGPDGLADGFPDMRRVYNAMELSVEKRFSSRWSLIANYRLAKLFGNYEGSFRNDNGQSDPNITSLFDFVNSPAIADQFKVGVLPTDRRNIVNLFGNYTLNKHWNFGMGFSSESGTPLSGFDAHPAYGSPGEIPVGGRGAYGRTPWGNYVDARVAYTLPLSEKYKLRFAADMFNIGNRQTTTRIDQDLQLSGGPTNNDFLKSLEYHRPFHAQFSARLDF